MLYPGAANLHRRGISRNALHSITDNRSISELGRDNEPTQHIEAKAIKVTGRHIGALNRPQPA